MKISGFTIIRNGVEFDYPFVESIQSLLPLVDELVVNVGISTDPTLEVIKGLAATHPDKIVLFESRWPLDDPEKRKGGRILAEQTNLALARCTGDWCFYLQADEVLHEEDTRAILESLRAAHENPSVDGVLFDYVHLYGAYNVEHRSRSAYRREVRAIKNRRGIQSVGDAQSFRRKDGEKPLVLRTRGRIFHYGWVRTPEAMKSKTEFMDQLYHTDGTTTGDNYRYKKFWGLFPFRKTHPAVMCDRIAKQGWHWDLKNSPFVWKFSDAKKVLFDGFEKVTGSRPFEYQSYQLAGGALPDRSSRPIPKASVILATYEMPKHLEMSLEALLRQTTNTFEVLLCDDGSGAETAAVVEKYRDLFEKQGQFLLHLWQPNQGFRKTRLLNQAILRSRGELLVFLDADCVPNKNFVADHLGNYQPGHYSAGRRIELSEALSANLSVQDVRKGFFDGPSIPLLRSVLKGETTHFQRSLRVPNPFLRKLLKMDRVVDLKGCNYSLSRADMLKIAGYDEAYEGYGREDTDVELRLKNLGLKIRSLKGLALQYHVWHPRREFTPANENLLDEVMKTGRVEPKKSALLNY